MSLSTMAGAISSPLYIKNRDILKADKNNVTGYEICKELSKVVTERNIEGAQLIRGLWKIYVSTVESQTTLLVKGVVIRGILVTVHESNPYVKTIDSSPVEKVLIKDLPLDVDSKIITDYLEQKEGLILKSDVKFGRIRDQDGKWTNFRNGDRFVYVQAPITSPGLPRDTYINGHACRLFHDSQEEQCKVCRVSGHKTLSDECPALNTDDNIVAFKSWKHIMSNFAPCEIEYKGKLFKSSEAVYMHDKAIDQNKPNIAEKIRKAKHAGAANAIARDELEGKESQEWLDNDVDVMRKILRLKATFSPEFRQALIESGDMILAEATGNMFWATGLSVYMTAHSKPESWHGENMLGKLLMDLRKELMGREDSDESQIIEEEDDEEEYEDTEDSIEDVNDVEKNEEKKETATTDEDKERHEEIEESKLREESVSAATADREDDENLEQMSPTSFYKKMTNVIFGNKKQTKIDDFCRVKSVPNPQKKRLPSQTPPNEKGHKKLKESCDTEIECSSPFTIINSEEKNTNHPPDTHM